MSVQQVSVQSLDGEETDGEVNAHRGRRRGLAAEVRWPFYQDPSGKHGELRPGAGEAVMEPEPSTGCSWRPGRCLALPRRGKTCSLRMQENSNGQMLNPPGVGKGKCSH